MAPFLRRAVFGRVDAVGPYAVENFDEIRPATFVHNPHIHLSLGPAGP